MREKKFQNMKGITLVALIITIIIIIILATITINLAIGDNGIIKQAKNAKEDAEGTIESVDKNMNKLLDDYFNLMLGGGGGTEPGEDKIPPTVNIQVGTVTENSIQITVIATDNESGLADNGTYKYYLNGVEKGTDINNTYTFSGLSAETQYTIKVEAFDKAGNKGENSTTVSTTKTIPPEGSVTEDGVPIPKDFYYVGGKKDDGVVISDNVNDKSQGVEHEKVQGLQGNQFVWVPVENPNTMFTEEKGIKLTGVTTTTDVYSKLRGVSGGKPGSTAKREPDLLSQYDNVQAYWSILGSSQKDMADKMVAEYKAMYESIKKYKGFYIGRYELSGSITNPTSKAGKVIENQHWYYLKKACMEIIEGNNQVNSTMIYGNQWDETMSWLKTKGYNTDTDSSSWGNYYGTGAGIGMQTGSRKEWSANHIYDLAGNYWELTQEASDTNRRTARGRILWTWRFYNSSFRTWI